MAHSRTIPPVPALTRRGFHRLALGAAIAGAGFASRRAMALPVTAPSAGHRQVTLAGVRRGSGPAEVGAALRRAVLGTTDLSWLSRGDSVLVKPVCNSGNVYPATTDPLALYEMITLLREHGAGRVIVADMSGVQFVRFSPDRLTGSSRALMTNNGLLAAAQAAGAEVQAFEEAGWDGFYDETPTRGDNWKQPLLLPKVLKEVDHVVLMPRCSRHLLAGSTLGLKAAVGWWRHDSRLEYHHDARTFAEKTAESNTTPTLLAKQRLVVTSATKVLTTFGPDQGHVQEPDTGLILASESVVAHDMASLAWLIANREATPAGNKDSAFDDPNQSAWFASTANRAVNYFLGGVGKALSADALEPWSTDTVWQDRVLNRAFDVFGGVPEIDFVDANEGVPDAIVAALTRATQRPAGADTALS
jgi:uncharacterized protein (DUF362 family)